VVAGPIHREMRAIRSFEGPLITGREAAAGSFGRMKKLPQVGQVPAGAIESERESPENLYPNVEFHAGQESDDRHRADFSVRRPIAAQEAHRFVPDLPAAYTCSDWQTHS